jgi:MOSC domain-containing protein YiiM
MKVVAVSVGQPRTVDWHGRIVTTSIFKTPVTGRVRVAGHNLDGDRQSDLDVHGGPDKAVYAYPSEHYGFWREELPGIPLAWGAFGENLTTEGLLDETVRIGDRYRIGNAEFSVTQPRMPCFKLGIRFNDAAMVKRFLRSGRLGFYFSVVREGEFGAGDAVTLVHRNHDSLSVKDIGLLYTADNAAPEFLRKASELPGLAAVWREELQAKIV